MKKKLLLVEINQNFMQDQHKFDEVFSIKPSYGPFYALTLNQDLSKDSIDQIFANLQSTNSVKEIKLLHSRMESDIYMYNKLNMIKVLFKTNKSIENLDLSGNILKKGHIKALAKIVKENNHIKSLKLSNTALNNNKIKVLANNIHVSLLEELDLSYNLIKAEGIKSILGKFQTEKNSLKILNLSHNYAGNQVVKSLIQCMKYTNKIKSISVAANAITDHGMGLFVLALESSKALYSLDISYNHCKKEGLDHLLNFIAKNESVVSLNVSRAFLKVQPYYLDYELAQAIIANKKIIYCDERPGALTQNAINANSVGAQDAWDALYNFENRLLGKKEYKILIAHNRKMHSPYESGHEELLPSAAINCKVDSFQKTKLISQAIKNLKAFMSFIEKNNIHYIDQGNYKKLFDIDDIKIRQENDEIVFRIDTKYFTHKLPQSLRLEIFSYLSMHDFSALCTLSFGLLCYASRFLDRSKMIEYPFSGVESMFFNMEAYFINYYNPDSRDIENENLNGRMLFHFLRLNKTCILPCRSDVLNEAACLDELDDIGSAPHSMIGMHEVVTDNSHSHDLDIVS